MQTDHETKICTTRNLANQTIRQPAGISPLLYLIPVLQTPYDDWNSGHFRRCVQ